MSLKRKIVPVFVPVLLIILAALIAWKWTGFRTQIGGGERLSAFFIIFPILPYILFIVGMILGWRLNKATIILISFISIFSYYVLHSTYNLALIQNTILFLLPINFIVLSKLWLKRLFTKVGIIWLGIVVLQIVIFSVILNFSPYAESQTVLNFTQEYPNAAANMTKVHTSFAAFVQNNVVGKIFNIPLFISALAAFAFLGYDYYRNRNALSIGFLLMLAAIIIGINIPDTQPSLMLFFSVAAIIQIISVMESSLNMAYIDKLTNLPGRRSLNETLVNLGKNFAIAMIDIDHFKKFNDTYGHKVGDQVLKMVASKLNEVAGGGKAFRYGGEEFTVVFPNKNSTKAKPFMEEYRQDVANSPFQLRNEERKKSSEGDRGKVSASGKSVSVTVSVGIASSSDDMRDPNQVLKAADKTLYKAKKTGRNKVCIKR